MKTELFYGRIEPESMTVEQLKALIWRYFISYWNRRRICSANDGLPPVVKRQRFYAALDAAAYVPQIFELNVSTDIDKIIARSLSRYAYKNRIKYILVVSKD